MLSYVQLSAAPWAVAHQAPLSMRFLRQEYWSGLPFPPPGDRPSPGIEPVSLASPALTGGFFTTESPGKPPKYSPTPGLGWENHIPLKNKRTVQNGRKDPETSCCKSSVVWKPYLERMYELGAL